MFGPYLKVADYGIVTNSVLKYYTLDPCLPYGATYSHAGVDFIGSGNYSACFTSLRPLLKKESCSGGFLNDTCSLNGNYQPSLTPIDEFFGFSEFYYTSEDCLKLAGDWNLEKFQGKASKYCATNWSVLEQNWKNKRYDADYNRVKHQCFKSAWVPVSIFNVPNLYIQFLSITFLQFYRWYFTTVSIFQKKIKSLPRCRPFIIPKFNGHLEH